MITLYIKTHNTTGLKYFGRTVQDPYMYKGSGTYWTNHIKKYGNDVTTEIYAQYEDVCFGLIRTALRFSRDNNIVESNDWANVIEETGLSNHILMTNDIKEKISKTLIGHKGYWKDKKRSKLTNIKVGNGNRNKVVSKESREKISKSMTGLKRKIVECPHCGKEGGNSQMKRWHFDKCKLK